MITGWYKNTNGKWSYLDIDKGYAYHDCTILIDRKYYSFDENCYWIDKASVDSIKNTLSSIQKDQLEKQQKANLELGVEYSFSGHVKKLSGIYKSIV